jgi:hypothetical protein
MTPASESADLSAVLRVRARFIQSVMVPQLLLPRAAVGAGFLALRLLVHQETVQQIPRLSRGDVALGESA